MRACNFAIDRLQAASRTDREATASQATLLDEYSQIEADLARSRDRQSNDARPVEPQLAGRTA